VDNGGSQWLVDPVRSGISQFEPDHADAIGEELPVAPWRRRHRAGRHVAAAGTTTTPAARRAATGSTSATATVVDVLVLYTPGFKKRDGSVWATRISQLVALGEPGLYRQRRADAAAAGRHRTDRTATPRPIRPRLSSLAKGTGAYRTVPALRKKYGADMVTLVRPFYMKAQGGNCGVGYIGGYNGSNIAGYGSYAYSVVSDGRDMAGTSYYCTDYTYHARTRPQHGPDA
jgi:hypothetical protein